MLQNDYIDVEVGLSPTEHDDSGICVLNYEPFLRVLHERDVAQIFTSDLIDFVQTLGKNKSGSENGIGRLQYFLNAFIEEAELFKCNSNRLEFVGNDHYSLIKNSTGSDDPDFRFFACNGNTYTIEVKLYKSLQAYEQRRSQTNFHKADYCLAFFLNEKRWLFSKQIDNYAILYSVGELSSSDPWLAELELPESLTVIKFSIPGSSISFNDLTNQELKAYKTANYSFNTTKAININLWSLI